MSSVALTNRLAITEKPPMTTKRAPSATIAATATSSSGSATAIGPLDRTQQFRALRGEVLAAPQQLADRGIRWRSERLPLFGIELGPLSLVAWR